MRLSVISIIMLTLFAGCENRVKEFADRDQINDDSVVIFPDRDVKVSLYEKQVINLDSERDEDFVNDEVPVDEDYTDDDVVQIIDEDPPDDDQDVSEILAHFHEVTLQLPGFLEEVREKYNNPEVAIALFHPSAGMWQDAEGFFNREGSVELKPLDHFRVASITKTFVAATILRLFQEGRLSLDQTINKWFPDMERGDVITVRMLLNHTSGIIEYSDALFYLELMMNPDKKWDPRELMQRGLDKGFLFESGTDTEYCNTNYIMLGIIIEEVTGKRVGRVIKEFFTDPLSLPDTMFDSDDNLPFELVHAWVLGKDYAYWADPSAAWTAGAVVSNVSDLAMWAHYLYGKKIFNEQTYDEMFTLFNNQVGLGVLVFYYSGGIAYQYSGGFPGYASFLAYFPSLNISYALLTAAGSPNVFMIAKDLADMILAVE